jgi:hypothetical protein
MGNTNSKIKNKYLAIKNELLKNNSDETYIKKIITIFMYIVIMNKIKNDLKILTKDINNIFNTNGVNFNDIFKNILDKIDDGINSINAHNEKINSLNS